MNSLSKWDYSLLIKKEIAAVTGQSVENLSEDLPFTSFGIESLQAVSILANLSEKLGNNLPVTLLFDYPTIKELSESLSEKKETINLPSDEKNIKSNEPIAIIGMACRFPKANDINVFWSNIKSGVDCISQVPSDRWDWQEYKKYPSLRWGGFIDGIDYFDNEMFSIPEPEAAKMDPQQRILLECVHEAIENSGYRAKDLQKTMTGVFIGISSSDYSIYRSRLYENTSVFDATGNAHSISANRISYIFNLRGPSLSIDTACSSSLVAMHEACKSLQLGETNMAIVGGVNIILSPEISVAFAEAGMLAPDGHCKTFSQEANGYVRSEGAGVIILKRLSDAIANKDNIICAIRSSAVNHDGRTNGLTAPSGPAQEAVIRQALKNANLTPADISFIEAHGTGTALGDPIEFLTLARIFSNKNENKLQVGSVKANIGHLEAAAGMGGIIKTALVLKNRYWPKQIQFKAINEKMAQAKNELQINTQGAVLNENRIYNAGVSSFGFGGTNAHIILESVPNIQHLQSETVSQTPYFLAFSATTESALKELGEKFTSKLQKSSFEEIATISAVSRLQRLSYPKRACVYGETKDEMLSNFNRAVVKTINKSFQANIVFAFTGQGTQYQNLGMSLYKKEKIYREAFWECSAYLDVFFQHSLLDIIQAKDQSSERLLQQTDYGQAIIFAMEYSLWKLLDKKYEIKPQFVFGHSLGEITAATVARKLSLAEACKLVAARGLLMQNKTAPGKMLSANFNFTTASEFIKEAQLPLDIAAINGPNLVTISGDPNSIDKLQNKLHEKGIKSKALSVTRAFHSRLMDPILSDFKNCLTGINFQEGNIPLISSLTGEFLNTTYTAEYWQRHVREPTQFLRSIQTLHSKGVNTIIEVGPQPTIVVMGQQCIDTKNIFWIPLLKRDQPEFFNQALAELAILGILEPRISYTNVEIPTTSFAKKHFPRIAVKQQKKEQVMKNENILNEICILVAGLLQVEPNTLDVDVNLTELGADSLLLLNAIQSIKDRYGVSIAIADVFRDLSSLRAIADYVAANKTTATNTVYIEKIMQESAQTSVHTNNDLRSVIQQQLAIMREQLALLEGKKDQSIAPATMAPVKASVSVEAKGVLGNFRSHANREANADEVAKQKYMDTFIAAYNKKTKKTKDHTQKYRQYLADNRVSAGFRPNIKEMIYAIVFHSGQGAHFRDLDGNDYIDFTMGFGANLFGHCPDFIEKRIREQIDLGYCVGPQAELAGIVAEKTCKVVGHERAVFLNSGTEAVMTAMRLARAVTKRNKIVIFEGAYHGHADVVLARAGAGGEAVPVAPGVPTGLISDIIVLPYNEASSLDFIRKNAHSFAAVLVEPVQSRYPEVQPKEFLQEIRKITEQSGAAMIFDEVICGLRMAPGGAQEYFGIKADLASYGKILGGGMPIGAIAGNSRFLDAIDGGFWQFGDTTYPKAEMTFFAGTFCKHPMTMAAADAVLNQFLKNGKGITTDLNDKTNQIRKQLNDYFANLGLDLHVNNFGSLFRFKANTNLDLFFANLNYRGAYVWEGRNLFLSTAHTDKDIDSFIGIVKESTEELIKEGFLRKKL